MISRIALTLGEQPPYEATGGHFDKPSPYQPKSPSPNSVNLHLKALTKPPEITPLPSNHNRKIKTTSLTNNKLNIPPPNHTNLMTKPKHDYQLILPPQANQQTVLKSSPFHPRNT